MKCKKCGKNSAAFFISWGEALGPKIGFCETCGEEVGIFTALRRVESLLHGFGIRAEGDISFEGASVPLEFAEECNNCGTTLKEFERRFLFGCEECGKVFGSLLANYLTLLGAPAADGFGFFHGSPPKSFTERAKLFALRNKLSEKIASEDYSAAATHRDQLNELEEKIDRGGHEKARKLSDEKVVIREATRRSIEKLLLKTPELPAASENWLLSQLEIRRNLADFCFPPKMDEVQRGLVEDYLIAMFNKKWTNGLQRINTGALEPIEMLAMGERFFSRRPNQNSKVYVSADGCRTMLINDADHLAVGVRSRDRDPLKALAAVKKPLERIERDAEIAFSPRFGYLTTAPRHIGTGLTVSVLLHLPYSFFRGRTFFWPENSDRASVRIDSFSGKNLEHHAFYRVSGTVGFGAAAEKIVTEVFSFAEKLIEEESNIRGDFKPSEVRRLKNIMPRVIQHSTRSYRLSYQDILRFTTFFALGIERGAVDLPGFSLDDVIPRMSSMHIMYADGGTYSVNQCEKRRADLFAELFDNWAVPAVYKKK